MPVAVRRLRQRQPVQAAASAAAAAIVESCKQASQQKLRERGLRRCRLLSDDCGSADLCRGNAAGATHYALMRFCALYCIHWRTSGLQQPGAQPPPSQYALQASARGSMLHLQVAEMHTLQKQQHRTAWPVFATCSSACGCRTPHARFQHRHISNAARHLPTYRAQNATTQPTTHPHAGLQHRQCSYAA